MPIQVVLMYSHICEETVSRTRRAFSRAAASEPTIELELVRS
jgi:hypothetical protein